MRSLYGIGRDGWVWDMSITQWLDIDSSHEVGECSVTVVCPLAGRNSGRPLNRVIVVVVGADVVVDADLALVVFIICYLIIEDASRDRRTLCTFGILS